MSKITPFSFEKRQVRVVTIDGEPWFVGKDVCDALGYKDSVNALKQHGLGLLKYHPIADSLGRLLETRVINEADVMRLIVGSTLPDTQAFELLVFETILPQVRKIGACLPDVLTLEKLTPALANQFGGLLKSLVDKEIEVALQELLPQMVRSYIASQRSTMREVETAGQVWHRHLIGTFRGGPQMLSHLLSAAGCRIDGEGLGQLGDKKAKLFDPDKADIAMTTGGLRDYCMRWVAEKHAQAAMTANPI